jgi:hypothetical protein
MGDLGREIVTCLNVFSRCTLAGVWLPAQAAQVHKPVRGHAG